MSQNEIVAFNRCMLCGTLLSLNSWQNWCPEYHREYSKTHFVHFFKNKYVWVYINQRNVRYYYSEKRFELETADYNSIKIEMSMEEFKSLNMERMLAKIELLEFYQ